MADKFTGTLTPGATGGLDSVAKIGEAKAKSKLINQKQRNEVIGKKVQ